jgi:hypothetical protein
MAGCLLIPFKVLGFIFKGIWSGILWCFHSGIKGYVVFAFCVLVIGFILGSFHHSPPAEQTAQSSQTGEPTKVQAPFIVTTDTRYFYIQSYTRVGDGYLLVNVWAFEGKKWVKYETLHITNTWGTITIGKR